MPPCAMHEIGGRSRPAGSTPVSLLASHQRNQRRRSAAAKHRCERVEIDRRRRASTGNLLDRWPDRTARRASTEGCSIAETSSRRWRFAPWRSMPGDSASAFASVPPEVKMTLRGIGADQRRDLLARLLDELPRRPAFAMHRGRIAGRVPAPRHRRARLRPQRRGRIPVEIDALGHCILITKSTFSTSPKDLLFALNSCKRARARLLFECAGHRRQGCPVN